VRARFKAWAEDFSGAPSVREEQRASKEGVYEALYTQLRTMMVNPVLLALQCGMRVRTLDYHVAV
jgi:hypothetical protein